MQLLMSRLQSTPWLNLVCGPPPDPPPSEGSGPAVEDAEP
jgi:hypothetical protein